MHYFIPNIKVQAVSYCFPNRFHIYDTTTACRALIIGHPVHSGALPPKPLNVIVVAFFCLSRHFKIFLLCIPQQILWPN